MKNIKKIVFAVLTLSIGNVAVAQNNILNALSPDEIGEQSIEEIYAKADGPIPYEYVNDKDIMFQKKVLLK